MSSTKGPLVWAAIKYKPLPWAVEHVHNRDEPIIVGAAGRRVGKSKAAKAEVWKEAYKGPIRFAGVDNPRVIYVVAPDMELTDRIWKEVTDDIVPESSPMHSMLESYEKVRKLIRLKNGNRIQAKTAENERTLAGESVTLAIVDEAHAVSDSAMSELEPALSNLKGRIMAFGIPQSNNWFRRYYELGQRSDAKEHGIYSFSVPSTANPFFPAEILESEKYRMPDVRFRQLYLAEWAEAEGKAFRNFDQLFVGEPEPPGKGPYLMGLDVAMVHDYTVAYIIDIPRMQFVAKERFNKIDWPVQIARIANLYNSYKCLTACTDVTAIGGPVASMMRMEGISVSDYSFTNDSKMVLVNTLAAEIEHGRVTFLKDDDNLRDELRVYEGTLLPGGKIRYNAPSGFYDDCVVSAALAVYKAKKRSNAGQNVGRGSYVKFKRPLRRLIGVTSA